MAFYTYSTWYTTTWHDCNSLIMTLTELFKNSYLNYLQRDEFIDFGLYSPYASFEATSTMFIYKNEERNSRNRSIHRKYSKSYKPDFNILIINDRKIVFRKI